MSGYIPNFTGVDIPLPTFDNTLDEQVLKKPSFDQNAWRKNIHFSVAVNFKRRQPICVALNIDQGKLGGSEGSKKNWSLDPEVEGEFQINNDYYRNNEWDRGHMARRASAAWGDTLQDRRAASEATYFYTNACLQHKNLNQDEWLDLEDWVKNLQEDQNDKISVFSGPFYAPPDGTPRVYPGPMSGRNLDPVEIPAGFYKVVAFIDKTSGNLTTKAFVILQDEDTIKDMGPTLTNFVPYQVSTSEVERRTGLVFAEKMHMTNPMKEDAPIVVTPPRPPTDVVTPPPTTVPSVDFSQVFIAAALVNPEGDERAGEWVAIANYSPVQIDLTGWTLTDPFRKPLSLSGVLLSGETVRVNPLRSNDGGSVILSNKGGSMTLKDQNGTVINVAKWNKSTSGAVTVFSTV